MVVFLYSVVEVIGTAVVVTILFVVWVASVVVLKGTYVVELLGKGDVVFI